MSYYIHETPGRLRVRTPIVKDSAEKAAAVTRILSALRGVRRVVANPATGSVTIHYMTHVVCPSSLINTLAGHGFIEGIIGFPRRTAPVRPVLLTATAVTAFSPGAKKALILAAKLMLPFLAERAFGRTGRAIVASLL